VVPSAVDAEWVNPVRFREAQFLIWCARETVPESLRRRILESAQAGLNWPLLLDLAKTHGVEALLARTLTGLCADHIPPADLGALRRGTEVAAAVSRAKTEDLLRLFRCFNENGISVLPVRGVGLAASMYGDLTLCASSDPVVLVHREQLADVGQVLVSQGYTLRGGDGERTVNARVCEPLVYHHAHTLSQIELLWAESHAGMIFPIDRPEVWGFAKPVSLDGRKIRGMASEEALLLLSVQGTHQAWRQLSFVTEVAGLIHARRLNWKRMLATAREWKCYRILLLGLALSHRIMEAPIPPQILTMIDADPDVLSVARRMPRSLLVQPQEGLGDPDVGALLFTLQDDWSTRWQYGIALCRSRDPAVQAPPDWFRWRRSLPWFARAVSPVHTLARWLSPPSSIRHLFHR